MSPVYRYHFAGDGAWLQALRGLLRLVPVAAHHVAAADHQFARAAVRQALAVLVHEPDFFVRHAASDAHRPDVELLGRQVRHALAFGQAVHREQRGLRNAARMSRI